MGIHWYECRIAKKTKTPFPECDLSWFNSNSISTHLSNDKTVVSIDIEQLNDKTRKNLFWYLLNEYSIKHSDQIIVCTMHDNRVVPAIFSYEILYRGFSLFIYYEESFGIDMINDETYKVEISKANKYYCTKPDNIRLALYLLNTLHNWPVFSVGGFLEPETNKTVVKTIFNYFGYDDEALNEVDIYSERINQVLRQ